MVHVFGPLNSFWWNVVGAKGFEAKKVCHFASSRHGFSFSPVFQELSIKLQWSIKIMKSISCAHTALQVTWTWVQKAAKFLEEAKPVGMHDAILILIIVWYVWLQCSFERHYPLLQSLHVSEHILPSQIALVLYSWLVVLVKPTQVATFTDYDVIVFCCT